MAIENSKPKFDVTHLTDSVRETYRREREERSRKLDREIEKLYELHRMETRRAHFQALLDSGKNPNDFSLFLAGVVMVRVNGKLIETTEEKINSFSFECCLHGGMMRPPCAHKIKLDNNFNVRCASCGQHPHETAASRLLAYLQGTEDFCAGYDSGMKHDTSLLCLDNLRKAKLPHDSKPVADYWQGYMLAVQYK